MFKDYIIYVKHSFFTYTRARAHDEITMMSYALLPRVVIAHP